MKFHDDSEATAKATAQATENRLNVIITGAKGFIAKNFIHKLGKFPQYYNIIALDWHDSFIRKFPDFLNRDIDWIIHLGAETNASESNSKIFQQKNVDFTLKLFEQCAKYNINIQWASSVSVYGNKNYTYNESDEVNPLSYYAESKAICEEWSQFYMDDIIIQGFRYFDVFGSMENTKKSYPNLYAVFEQQAKKDGIIRVWNGSDRFIRDYIHVEDLIDIQLSMMHVQESGIWNIGTGKGTSILNIAKEVVEVYGSDIRFVPFPKKIVSRYREFSVANINKIKQSISEVDGHE
jgi:ADP-L-glycero-D-manno-heptose 6-epimerase